MGLRHWKYVSADTFMVCPVLITYSGSRFRPLDKGKNKASILRRTPAAHRFRIRIETCF